MSALVSLKEYEQNAYQVLVKDALDYYRSGAGQERTLENNRKAFTKFRIRPRMLRDVSKRDLSVVVLGEKISIPVGVAPVGLHKMVHPSGEIASAKAAEALGTIFTLSTMSSVSIEEVASAAPRAVKWFQLYVFNDRQVTKDLVSRAEKAGFKALVLTVDVPVVALRLANIKKRSVYPDYLTLANFQQKQFKTGGDQGSAPQFSADKLIDASLQWRDVQWLKSITKLPVILKGILTAEDARLAIKAGAAGIVVSNHGARQLDDTPATIEVLPEIVKAVRGSNIEVYMDGGVTEGTDVFKALALGAKMVFMGRPIIWGLAHSGEEGVKHVLELVREEFDNVLALAGCAKVSDIMPEMVVHKSYYSKM